MNRLRPLIYQYMELMGQACGHENFTEDNRLVVHHAAKKIMELTAHGNEVHHDQLPELAKEIHAIFSPFAR